MGYTYHMCCDYANSTNSFVNSSLAVTPISPICHQSYSPGVLAAKPLYVSYSWCSTHCPGFGLSQGQDASQWADGFVQFILPSIIFSMTIPRQQKIGVSRLFDYFFRPLKRFRALQNTTQLVSTMILSVILVLPFVTLDVVSWISLIFIGAGPMLLSAMFEALVDYRVISAISTLNTPGRDDSGQNIRSSATDNISLTRDEIVELLTAVVCGNLMLDVGDPHHHIIEKLSSENGEEIKTRLLHMMSAQNSFGSTIGAPVLFYLGAFVYTILNLFSNPSSEDAAISIALGVEWMIIVHVAIVSGCLLASNNPSTISAVVGLAPVQPKPILYRNPTIAAQPSHGNASNINVQTKPRYPYYLTWLGLTRPKGKVRHLPLFDQCFDTRFQPVWLWERGHNKLEWIKRTKAWKNHTWFQKKIHLSPWNWLLFLYLPTIILIVFPPAAGGVVAYDTPPIGWACRSLTLSIYAGCQIILTTVATVYTASESHVIWSHKAFTAIPWFFTGVAILFSLFAGIGGSMMQIMGVYRNCVCYVTAGYWLNPDAFIPGIQVATDTQLQRDSSKNWLTFGYAATTFMAIVCYMGYRYQLELRYHFVAEVKALEYDPAPGPVPIASAVLSPASSDPAELQPRPSTGDASSSSRTALLSGRRHYSRSSDEGSIEMFRRL